MKVRGTVMYVEAEKPTAKLPQPLRTYGIQFEELRQVEKDVIHQYCFHLVLPKYFHQFAQRDSWGQRFMNWYANRQHFQNREFRQRVSLPCHITGPFSFYTVVNDMSRTGVAFTSHHQLEVGQHLHIEIYSPEEVMGMAIEIRSCQKISSGYVFIIGAKFIEPLQGTQHPLIPFMNDQGDEAAA